MGSRVPAQQYNLRSANSFIGSSVHDLSAAEAQSGEVEGIGDVDQDAVAQDGLDNDDDSSSVMKIVQVLKMLVLDSLLVISSHLKMYCLLKLHEPGFSNCLWIISYRNA